MTITEEDFKRLQAEIGWTNAETAENVGVTLKAVEHWRSGRRGIPEPVARLVRVFHRNAQLRHRRVAAQLEALESSE